MLACAHQPKRLGEHLSAGGEIFDMPLHTVRRAYTVAAHDSRAYFRHLLQKLAVDRLVEGLCALVDFCHRVLQGRDPRTCENLILLKIPRLSSPHIFVVCSCIFLSFCPRYGWSRSSTLKSQFVETFDTYSTFQISDPPVLPNQNARDGGIFDRNRERFFLFRRKIEQFRSLFLTAFIR